ncbi:acyltransferase family protein [Paraburkholderia azotifigens]|uniref:Acyltransferase n=1 Tax=Paraburkholderia azotifigens TaxID=2057004 RepID=A0A5C6VA14_9BURK|nr:acyltransferase [Paraburkholderia azotifigens]TXC82342.1 acyltransferase [Paraburkholderia azotifigens]
MKFNDDRYATLDGMRGVAALCVVALHVRMLFSWHEFTHAYLAVDLFFAISGFVLARTYEKRILAGELSAIEFMRLRAIRLYPLYLLGLVAGAIAAYTLWRYGMQPTNHPILKIGGETLVALLLLPAPFAHHLYPTNGPCWSLFAELLANAAYACFLPRLTNRILGVVIVMTWCAVLAIVMLGNFSNGYAWKGAYVGMVRVIFSFSIGVLIHRLAPTTRFRSNAGSLLIVALALLTISINVPERFEHLYILASVTAIIPLITWFAVHVEPAVAVRKVWIFTGAVSYGVYVLHEPIGALLEIVLSRDFHVSRSVMIFMSIPFLSGLIVLVAVLNRSYDTAFRRILLQYAVPHDRRHSSMNLPGAD